MIVEKQKSTLVEQFLSKYNRKTDEELDKLIDKEFEDLEILLYGKSDKEIQDHILIKNTKYRLNMTEKTIMWNLFKENDKEIGTKFGIKTEVLKKLIRREIGIKLTENDLINIFRSIMSKNIEIENRKDGTLKFLKWITSFEYKKSENGENSIILTIDEEIKNLWRLLKKYNNSNLENIFYFKTTHGKNLFLIIKDILKNNNLTNYKIFNIEKLQKNLNVKKSLEVFADFKRFVIEPSIKEINSKSSLYIEVEYIKTGKKYTDIKFLVRRK